MPPILSSHLHHFYLPKPCMHLYCPPHVPLSQDQLILIDLITHMIFGEQYRSYSSKLCSLLLSPVTLSPFYTNGLIINLTQHYYKPWQFLKHIPCWFHYLMLLYMVATCYKTHIWILFYILFIMHPSDLLHHSLPDNSIRQVTLVLQKEWVHQIHLIQTLTSHYSRYRLLSWISDTACGLPAPTPPHPTPQS